MKQTLDSTPPYKRWFSIEQERVISYQKSVVHLQNYNMIVRLRKKLKNNQMQQKESEYGSILETSTYSKILE